jgi:phenylpyruvate tautomerase PptA (4-oxalocrotonate tautomerase family)
VALKKMLSVVLKDKERIEVAIEELDRYNHAGAGGQVQLGNVWRN